MTMVAAVLIGACSLSNESLWIDEGHSAAKAMQPTLAGWWGAMVHDKGSDLQMPLYMFYLWAWAKVCGTSEIALRAANLPWFVAGVLSLILAFRHDRRRQVAIVILALSSAFLWYYIDEARPYAVLFAFAALATTCLLRLREDPASAESAPWFRLFLLGIVGLCATNMIAVPWAMGALAAFTFWIGPRATLRSAVRFPMTSLCAGLALVALALYYLWSLQSGARGTDVGHTSLATVGYALYELFGLAGLGPGRLALRAGGLAALSAHAREIALGAIAVLTLSVAGIEAVRSNRKRREVGFFACALAGPIALLIIAAGFTHLRLLGRHFTPMLPFLLVLWGAGLQSLLFAKRTWLRSGAVIAILILLASSLQIRFAPRHRRDDYRAAASLAQNALRDGKTIWWLADEVTGRYYKLPQDAPNLIVGSKLNLDSLGPAATPDLVCFSKPDIYDPSGRIGNYLRENNFRETRVLPAFQIFERPASSR